MITLRSRRRELWDARDEAPTQILHRIVRTFRLKRKGKRRIMPQSRF
ncbi:hypothetical protein [Bradyrhizobium sp. ARR65]|nr:hypothetical protein [Bradyrhizobium sp. ARR65]